MATKEYIQKLKKETNLLDLAREMGAVLTPAGNNIWSGRCPHPDHNDSTPSFRVWLNKDLTWSWSCMGCHCGAKDVKNKNYGTDCIAFVQWMSDYKGSEKVKNFQDVLTFLSNRIKMPLESSKNASVYATLKSQAQKRHENLSDKARAYLHTRGLDDNDIVEWQLGSFQALENTCGKVVERITFPLFSKSKNVLGFSNRVVPGVSDDVPKYINSKNSEVFNKSEYFYGIHNIDKNEQEIRITEGAMDVILATKHGAKNVVGTLGTAFTSKHVEMIKELGLTPVLIMDSDAAGIKAMKRALELLASQNIYAKVCLLPEGTDLADIAQENGEKIEELIGMYSKPYWQYQMQEAVLIYDAMVNDIRAKLVPAVLEASKGAVTDTDKCVMKSYVQEKLGIIL